MTSTIAMLAAEQGASPSVDDKPVPMEGDSPEARMSRRFPQKIKVAALLDIPVIDDDRKVLGHVRQVLRTPQGKIILVVAYSRWFGLFPRQIAVPIERVGILGRQVGSIDMPEKDYIAAPTFTAGAETPIPPGETIRIALAKR
jgi:hypothetical protein